MEFIVDLVFGFFIEFLTAIGHSIEKQLYGWSWLEKLLLLVLVLGAVVFAALFLFFRIFAP